MGTRSNFREDLLLSNTSQLAVTHQAVQPVGWYPEKPHRNETRPYLYSCSFSGFWTDRLLSSSTGRPRRLFCFFSSSIMCLTVFPGSEGVACLLFSGGTAPCRRATGRCGVRVVVKWEALSTLVPRFFLDQLFLLHAAVLIVVTHRGRWSIYDLCIIA